MFVALDCDDDEVRWGSYILVLVSHSISIAIESSDEEQTNQAIIEVSI